MRVVIVGAGIGGIALAVKLQRLGMEVVVLERAAEIQEIGAGVWITANAVKALRDIDIDLSTSAVHTEGQDFYDFATDECLYRTQVGGYAETHYGAPAYFVHRADFLDALLARIDPATMRPGSQVVAVEDGPRSATAILANGERIEGDLVVGADGLRSTVRESLLDPADAEFAGVVTWRSVFPADRVKHLDLEPGHQTCWVGPSRGAVGYELRSGELYNFVGLVPAAETSESWTETGALSELRNSYAGACDRLNGVIEAIPEAFTTALYHRPPTPRWSGERVVLLGDAAHPALPTIGQGAAMAVEDAVTLGTCLARHGANDVGGAFGEFTARRFARTSRVLAVSQANAVMLALDTPDLAQARNGRWRGMQALDPRGTALVDWLWSHDPVAALDEPPQAPPAYLRPAGDTSYPVDPVSRAMRLWATALTPTDRVSGWIGERAGYERFWNEHSPPDPAVRLTTFDCGGVPGLLSEQPSDADGPIVLYLHGGGFTLGSARSSAGFASRLAAAVDGRAVTIDYRLAPEHPFPAALADVLTAYRFIAGKHDNIVLAGDGSGGGLAVSLVAALRAAGDQLPDAIYVVSPFCDLSLTSPSIDKARGHDLWSNREGLTMMAAGYLQGVAADDPEVSPIHADLSGFPPLLVHVAEQEALYGDAVQLDNVARACGVASTLEAFPHAIHGFAMFPFLPDARQAVANFASFVETSRLAVEPR